MPLHLAPAPFVLALIAFDLWHNWRTMITLTVVITLTYWVPKLVNYKPRPRSRPVTVKDVVQDLRESPSALDLEMEDAKYAGTGWRMLEVRKGWARVAVGCDMFFVALVGLSVTAMVVDPTAEAQRTAALRLDASMVIGFSIAAAIFGFALYAHKKATEPRKPKRAWVPAFLRTNT